MSEGKKEESDAEVNYVVDLIADNGAKTGYRGVSLFVVKSLIQMYTKQGNPPRKIILTRLD